MLCDDSSTVCNNSLFLDCSNWWLYPLIVSAKGILSSRSLPFEFCILLYQADKNPIKTDRTTIKRDNREIRKLSENCENERNTCTPFKKDPTCVRDDSASCCFIQILDTVEKNSDDNEPANRFERLLALPPFLVKIDQKVAGR